MKINIKDIALWILIFFGYNYYTRRLIYVKGISLLDIIILGYIMISIFNKIKTKEYNIKKSNIIFFISLLIDFLVGIISGNKINYIFSDVMIIMNYMFWYLIIFNNKNKYNNKTYMLELFYYIALVSSVICIINYIFPNGEINNFYKMMVSEKEEIQNRIYGPELSFWLPVIIDLIFNKFKKGKIKLFSFLILGIPSIIILKNRQTIVMFSLAIVLIFIYKIFTDKNYYKRIFSIYVLTFIAILGIYTIKTSNDPRIQNMINIKMDTSIKYRLYTNDILHKEIKNNFPLGSGLGSTYYFQLNSNSEIIEYTITDNTYITVMWKLNIISIIFLCLVIIKMYISLKNRPAERILLISMLSSGLVSTHLIRQTRYIVIMIYIYLISSKSHLIKEDEVI
ncbi:hypothetical protein ACH36K_04735 [Clostridium sp. MB05]|uniref:hypothetical protein n=1 Tax=Clostridium sp. MB05 TaxID=3376682 RepID=UPI003981C96A